MATSPLIGRVGAFAGATMPQRIAASQH